MTLQAAVQRLKSVPMRRKATLIVALGALLSGATALAAQSSAPSTAEIVVNGRFPDQEKRNRAAVSALARPVPQGGFESQFGRWEEPVCVAVGGLPQDRAQFIADRIGTIAREVKIGAQAPGCHPNVYIVATNDPATLVTKARGSKSGLLSNISNNDIAVMEHSRAAVRWAALTGATGSSGERLGDDTQDTGTPMNNTLKVWHSSRIKANTRAVLLRMVIVLDMRQALGHSYRQLAAYLAMVSLAQLRPNADAPMVNTVLAAFRPGGDAPDDLSDFDHAYLKALYEMPADDFGTLQKQAMVGIIDRTMKAKTRH